MASTALTARLVNTWLSCEASTATRQARLESPQPSELLAAAWLSIDPHSRDERFDGDRLKIGRRLATEIEDLAYEVGASVALLAHPLDAALGGLAKPRLFHDDVGKTDDPLQDVVKVVSDAGGHATECGEAFLCL